MDAYKHTPAAWCTAAWACGQQRRQVHLRTPTRHHCCNCCCCRRLALAMHSQALLLLLLFAGLLLGHCQHQGVAQQCHCQPGISHRPEVTAELPVHPPAACQEAAAAGSVAAATGLGLSADLLAAACNTGRRGKGTTEETLLVVMVVVCLHRSVEVPQAAMQHTGGMSL